MKAKHLLACMAIMFGSVALYAAEPGTTCYTAIPLGKDYKADISGPQTVWYSAWTFDLPLAVYFMPQNESDPAPEVEMDFSCTSGIYSDPIICMLFCKGGTVTMPMPHKPPLETTTVEGKMAYYISMGKTYRDLLFKMGIDYNVEVFVKVNFKSAGFLSIAPDGMFSNCMDDSKFLRLGNEIKVKPNDDSTYVIAPYIQWRSDSIRYIWKGEKRCLLSVATTCDFDPQDNSDEKVVQYKRIEPNDTLRVTSEEINNYINNDEKPSEAGMFFAKFYSQSGGVMKVEKIPVPPPGGGATLLQYDKIADIPANNINALYAFPKSWTSATKFTTPTDHVFRMYIGTTPDFTKENAIVSYSFFSSGAGHWLGLFGEDMQALWKNTKEKYLYVRFECTATTTILPTEWEPSECVSKWQLIPKGENTLTIAKGSYGNVYRRLYYYDWKGGDMTLKWNGTTGACPAYIGNTCDFEPEETGEAVIAHYSIPRNGGVWTITAAEIDTWADKLDPDGYVYLLCNPSKQSTMDISTTAPDETDPVYPHATIKVECQDGNPQALTVTVSVPQHITVSGIGGFSEEWDATVDAPHPLNLPAGQYRLIGANEEITLFVP